ncbi:MAG: hypothetical protein HZB59_11955 [Ignavibacteriales bacterium]|nr:hypothetical protein [Ignavibacteriales bacterium]
MKKILFTVAFIVLTLIGCVRSLYPLFMEEDLIFNNELLGTWREKDGKSTWIFEKSNDKNYTLIHFATEHNAPDDKVPGDTVRFIAQLGKLGKYIFLDIFPGKPDTKVKNDFYDFHLLPVHTISRVWLTNDTLKLSMLDNDWLAKMIDKNAYRIKHARLNDQLILTASTKELQQLVIKYANNTKAFPKPGELHRVK